MRQIIHILFAPVYAANNTYIICARIIEKLLIFDYIIIMQICFQNNNVIQIVIDELLSHSKNVIVTFKVKKTFYYYGYIHIFYRIEFDLEHSYSKYFSFCGMRGPALEIMKKSNIKLRFDDRPILCYKFFYIYFIYNKYYSFYNTKSYDLINDNCKNKSYRKLFNCRDYYKLHSYISAPI